MEWKGMERCHFSGSKESLGDLVECKIFSNPLGINADFSSLRHSDKPQLVRVGQIKRNFLLVMNGRQFWLAVKTRCKLQLSSRAVYINGKDRSECSMGSNIPSPVGFKFEF